jgi:hypothetical protein
MITCLDACIVLDLYYTLRNSFESPINRTRWYVVTSFTYSLVGTLVIAFVGDFLQSSLSTITVTLSQKLFFFLTTVPSLVYTVFRLRQPGLSRQYKILIAKRHVAYALLVLLYQITATCSYLQIIGWISSPILFQKFCAYYFALASVFLSCIRLTEPSVKRAIYKELKQLASKIQCKPVAKQDGPSVFDKPELIKDDDCIGDTLNSFLTSSLNNELVYTILMAINKIVKTPQLQSFWNGDIPKNRFDDYSMSVELTEVKIFNQDIWSSARQQQFINCPNMPFETFIDTKFSVSDFIILDKEVKVEGFFIKNFGRLRHQDGIHDSIVDQSLDPILNRSNVFKSGEASGASGSFFFFSYDRNFIVKTMTNKEMKFFCGEVANGYFNHLKENPESMLARIYGVYTVRSFGIQPVNIMLMAHTLKIRYP